MIMLDEKIKKVIQDVLYDYPTINTKRGAFNKCRKINNVFRDKLIFDYPETKIIRVSGYIGYLDNVHTGWKTFDQRYFTHYATLVNDNIVDLTWRQFEPQSLFPYILTKYEFIKKWTEIESVKS